MHRRSFFVSLFTAIAGLGLVLGLPGCAEPPAVSVVNNLSIVVDRSDGMVVAAPVQRAIDQLRRTLMSRGFVVLQCSRISEAGSTDLCIVVTSAASAHIRELGAVVPDTPGAPAIVPGRLNGHEVLLAAGRDEAGLVQALTEISEAIARSPDPSATLRPAHAREPSVPFGTIVAPVGAAPSPAPRSSTTK